MKIIIVGAGAVGFQIGERLSAEQHDVVIVDRDPEKIMEINKTLDVLTVVGQGGDYTVLDHAGIRECDILIAATDVDEINMIACFIAKKFEVPLKIARIRSYLFQSGGLITMEELGIDVRICPEEVATEDICRLIDNPAAFEIVDFRDEGIQICGYRVSDKLPMVNHELKEMIKFEIMQKLLLLAIIREDDMIIPRGTNKLLNEDKVYVIGKTPDFNEISKFFSEEAVHLKYCFIIGISRLTRFLCNRLTKMGFRIKVFEPDRNQCLTFAEEFYKIEVINANPTSLEALMDEGLQYVDVFIAISDDEEMNVLSCMIAKKNKVKKTISKIQKMEYLPFTSKLGIDAVINPKISTVGEILKYVRGGNILSVDTLGEKDAEAIEYLVTESNEHIGIPFTELHLPRGCLIAAIIRNNEPIIPKGYQSLQLGDKVIVFTTPQVREQVSRFFQ